VRRDFTTRSMILDIMY